VGVASVGELIADSTMSNKKAVTKAKGNADLLWVRRYRRVHLVGLLSKVRRAAPTTFEIQGGRRAADAVVFGIPPRLS
jgi:hypothetical protein